MKSLELACVDEVQIDGKQAQGVGERLQARHPDTAASVREGLDEMFTVAEFGITGEVSTLSGHDQRHLSPNSELRRVSQRVTNYKDAQMVLRFCIGQQRAF